MINIDNVAQDRQELFTLKGRAMDPTKAALVQHIKGAVYQGGQRWGRMLQVSFDMPTLDNWGSNRWKLLWANYLSQVSHPNNRLFTRARKLAQDNVNVRKLH